MIYKNVLQIKVQLKYSNPNIYRVFYFKSDATFLELHTAIQIIMGWESSHLFQFRKGFNERIGVPFEDDGDVHGEDGFWDVRTTKIETYLNKVKSSVIYDYDFGDDWMHDVIVEKIIEEIELPFLPYVKNGKNACPFEDCGGIPGYYTIVESMKNKKSKAYKEFKEWVDLEDFDPLYFDAEECNSFLEDFDLENQIQINSVNEMTKG